MLVKAVYENSVLRPLEKLDLKEGDMVEIEVKKDAVDRLGGLVKISQRDVVDEIIESPDLEPFLMHNVLQPGATVFIDANIFSI